MIIGFVRRVECTHRDTKSSVDRVGTRACTEGITLFDGSRESKADDRSADSRIGGSPLDQIGRDAMLAGVVGCCEMSSVR